MNYKLGLLYIGLMMLGALFITGCSDVPDIVHIGKEPIRLINITCDNGYTWYGNTSSYGIADHNIMDDTECLISVEEMLSGSIQEGTI